MSLAVAKSAIKSSEKLFQRVIGKFPDESYLNKEDIVIIGLFIGIIKRSQSLLVLCESKYYSGTDSILRSIFESKVYLDFILKKHTKDRAKAYEYSLRIQHYKRIEWLQKQDENVLLSKMNLKKESLESFKPGDHEEIKEEYFDLTKRYSKKEKADYGGSKWYKVGGNIDTFEGLCESLGQDCLMEYFIAFKTWSEEVHGRDAKRFFEHAEGSLVIGGADYNDESIFKWITKLSMDASELMARKYNIPYEKAVRDTVYLAAQQKNINN
ncbi:hypothetical protein H7992_07080 [Sporosarcina sp. resist]|uniref:DUF5677 domain-containing protein n=1 Tax=Sporosarcina sp. resist TaxID=2762563 RepID=UPI00164CEA36|nr:DUF5677 domain-containing protein [Sporosarcina sp. resist]QNK89422.1 hypothetical protein H7992_07080 [Sporosarcina sp. resist]